jgi:hypothetical protein
MRQRPMITIQKAHSKEIESLTQNLLSIEHYKEILTPLTVKPRMNGFLESSYYNTQPYIPESASPVEKRIFDFLKKE